MRSALDLVITPPPPPPPPPLPPPSENIASEDSGHHLPSSSSSYSPSLIIITAIIAFVIIISASIHLLLRFLSRRSSSSASSSQLTGSSAASSSSPPVRGQNDLTESLPLFSLASSLAAVPKSSPDCAVCLSAFRPDDELRLLPACRHAFHAPCIDTWIRSTPSCPLCRSSIALSPPPAPPPPLAAEDARRSSGRSFRIEIGSVSRRTMPPEEDSVGAPAPSVPPRHGRTYSLGSSFEYVVEEEVEAVLARIRRRPEKEEVTEGGGPPPPGSEVAEAAGGGGRGWLKEYVDRLASSASSSFNSIRFSGRWSHRFDGGHVGGGRDSWDFELEESGLSTFYRWLTGV